MPHKCETRAGKARASRKSCGGWFRDLPNLPASPSQVLGDIAGSSPLVPHLRRDPYQPLDLDTLRRDHPLPGVVGAVVKLQRAGITLGTYPVVVLL